MNHYVTGLAACLPVLFTTTAEAGGRAPHFLQRQRPLTARGFAPTVVFPWMANPKATREAMARERDLSPQALPQRLGPAAQAFVRALLAEALHQALKAQRERRGLLDRFTEVLVADTTVRALPPALAAACPGGGGGSGAGEGAAALKGLIRWDVGRGELRHLAVPAGRTADQTWAAGAGDLPDGALPVADQGVFNTARWTTFAPRPFGISRGPAGTRVQGQDLWQTLGAFLAPVSAAVCDGAVRLVAKTAWPCRLAARRCPAEVANRRRPKRRA